MMDKVEKVDFMEVIEKRRSIRRYKPDPVPDEILSHVLGAARLAPSGGHRQPWHFIVVKNPERKKSLGIADWASEAPILLVGCTDAEASPRWYLGDFAVAFEHIVLAAANFGLGTCWIGRLGFEETMNEAPRMPDHIKVVAVTPLGYPNEAPEPKNRKALSEIVHCETF